jgi:hypothetical protein
MDSVRSSMFDSNKTLYNFDTTVFYMGFKETGTHTFKKSKQHRISPGYVQNLYAGAMFAIGCPVCPE